ncbi:polysaccharide deacetylase family protein [Frankia sp. Cas3]|uniref:polysaccharide deacetylase family protein n=1 Tax=Frankia sp. Cas3 TaxID=3073926 RepID=UPI002AD2497F|nr:polysaccharide deacetylase family protein [Frankia sp. Cas3]
MPLSRRALLAAGVAGPFLVGCAAPHGGSPGVPEPVSTRPWRGRRGLPRPDPPGSVGAVSSTRPVPASPTPTPTPVAGGVTRDEVIARYGSIRPVAWGLDVPGVTTMLPPTTGRTIALTFDACGGPLGSGYDQELIDFLRRQRVPATLFLNSRWIDANRPVFAELAADPLFEIGNHGTQHRPLSVSGQSAYGIMGTHDAGEVFDEVAGNRDKLSALLGRPPRFFRAGTAHCDDIATRIVADLDEHIVNFDVNGDAGATYPPDQVEKAVLTARPGSIIIGHMNHPAGGTAKGMAAALPRLIGAGFHFVRLSDCLTL